MVKRKKGPGGRPPLDPDKALSAKVQIFITPPDKQRLEAEAEALGRTFVEHCRAKLLA
jgi:hypothetical protein